jgi:hypothetical protein
MVGKSWSGRRLLCHAAASHDQVYPLTTPTSSVACPVRSRAVVTNDLIAILLKVSEIWRAISTTVTRNIIVNLMINKAIAEFSSLSRCTGSDDARKHKHRETSFATCKDYLGYHAEA